MKSDKEIIDIAKSLCNREDAECLIFISGFLAGYSGFLTGHKECLKEVENDTNATL